MKYAWLSLAVSTAFISGCSNMMYGNGMAPVVNNDYYAGQQNMAATQTAPVTQQRPRSAPVQQTPPQVRVEPVRTTVTEARIVPASVRQAEQKQIALQQQAQQQAQQRLQEAQAHAAQNKTMVKASNDGWEIRPKDAPPTATDTPKIQETIQRPIETAQQRTTETVQRTVEQTTQRVTEATRTTAENNMATATVKIEPPKQQAPKAIRPETTQENTVSETSAAQANAQTTKQEQKVASASNPPASQASGSSAVGTLLKQANAELGKGNLDGAAAYLNDASRIQPNNMKIRYDIANIRFHQGRYADAESHAASVANGSSNRAMQKKAWSLIANARKARGDNQGAIAAAEKASSL